MKATFIFGKLFLRTSVHSIFASQGL